MLRKTARAAILSIMLLASILMLAMAVFASAFWKASAGVPVIAQEHQSGKSYIVRAYNGHIAVFYGEISDSPAIETAIETETLRAVDREKLQKGIAVENYDDVLKLLEDFSS